MKLIDGQIMGIFCQVLYRHAEVVSGAYKLRKKEQGCGKNDDGTIAFRPLTEAELLEDSMQILQAQIHRLNEFVDALPSDEELRKSMEKKSSG